MRFTAIILILILALTACSVTPKDNGGNKAGATVTPIAEKPKTGGSINLYALRPDTLNPLLTKFKPNRDVLSVMFDPLITVGSDMRIMPALAEAYSVSDGGKRLSLRMRQGVKWHDGTGFTAYDVDYTFKVILNKVNNSYYAPRLDRVAAFNVLGSYDFELNLKEPDSGFIYTLNFPIIKADGGTDLNGKKADYKPIGTGRYSFSDYEQLNKLTAVKNMGWWGQDKPYADKVIVNILPDVDTVNHAFNTKLIDVATVSNEELSKYPTNNNVKRTNVITNRYSYICFNFSNPILNEKAIRRAINTAIDKDNIAKTVFMGQVVATEYPIYPLGFYYKPLSYQKGEKAAKAILEEAGFRDSNNDGIYENQKGGDISFELLVNEDNTQRVALTNHIIEALRSCGIKATVKAVPWDRYTRLTEEGGFDAFMGEMSLLEDCDLTFLLHSSKIQNGGKNYGRYKSAAMDGAIDAVKTAGNTEAFAAALGNVQDVFADELPHIALYFKNNNLVYNSAKLGGDFTGANEALPYFAINKWFNK